MNDKVSDEVKSQIIDHVRSQPFLFDPKNPDYKLRKSLKTDQLNVFGATLNPRISGLDVYNIWQNLRRQYATNKRKNNLASGSARSKEPKWKFYKSMSFLNDTFEPSNDPISIDQNLDDTNEHDDLTNLHNSVTNDSNNQIGSAAQTGSTAQTIIQIGNGSISVVDKESSSLNEQNNLFDETDIDIEIVNEEKKNKPKRRNDQVKNEILDVMGCFLDKMACPQEQNKKNDSPTNIFLQEIELLLNQIYNPNNSNEINNSFFDLENLKSDIKKMVISRLQELKKVQ